MSVLPSLPKKYKRTEAKLDGLVAAEVRKRNKNKNWLLEVKMKGGRMLPHQKVAQAQVESGTFLWKPPDMGQRNPGDYISLGDADAIYCVIYPDRKVQCSVNGGVIKYSFKV